MHPAFRRIFREQLDAYRAAQLLTDLPPGSVLAGKEPAGRSLNLVTNAVEIALEGSSYSLRTDARLFLMVNLNEFVAKPLSHPESPGPSLREVESSLVQDTRRILQAAAEVASMEPARNDLAASHILWGAGNVLQDLNLKSWRLWDRGDE